METNQIVSYDTLYHNCLLSSCAHAVYVLNQPYFSYEQSWDGNNYNFVYGTSRGTITFDPQRRVFAAAVREDKSSRITEYPQKNAIEFFASASSDISQLAEEETVQYLYDEIGGVEKPVITTSFWGDNTAVTFFDTWEDFLHNGGQYPSILFGSSESLMDYWLDEYKFTKDQFALVKFLYEAALNGKREMKRKELDKIQKIRGKEPGYNAFLESLAEMNLSIS